jgi:hypothetical protein
MKGPILNQVMLIGCLASAARPHEHGTSVDIELPRRDDREPLRVTCVAAGAIAATLREKGHLGASVLISGALSVDPDLHLHVRISAFQFL